MTTRIDEIRARLEKTRRVETQNRGGYIGVRLRSPFPLAWESMTHCPSSSCMPEADAHAVVRMWAHAPGDLEFLLGEVERLTGERDEARAAAAHHERIAADRFQDAERHAKSVDIWRERAERAEEAIKPTSEELTEEKLAGFDAEFAEYVKDKPEWILAIRRAQ